MNIIDAIRHHARMRPFDFAVIHPGGAVTYRQLAASVAAMAVKIRSHGVEAGHTVAVYTTDPYLHVLILLGAQANGSATISSHPGPEPMPAEAGVKAWLTDRALPFDPAGNVVTVGPNWVTDVSKDVQQPSHLVSGFTDEDAIMRMYTSSGTTGTPKVIGFTQSQADQMLKANIAIDPYVRGPLLSMMWLSTIGGYGFLSVALWHGSTLVLTTAPAAVLRAINLYNVSSLRASPQQLQGLVDMVRGQIVRFPSLERIELGGSSIPSSLLTAARAMLCSNVMGVYGSTEAGLIAQAPAAVMQTIPDAAGYVVPEVDVRIVDEDGRDLGLDVEGAIHVRPRFMTAGYIGDAEATAKGFKDGWFVPGDLGVLRADGLLRITGRVDEVINSGGVKLNPMLVDDFLMTQPGITDAAAFAYRQPGRHDEVWAAVVCGPEFNEEATLAAARQKLGSRAPRKLVRMDQIPRNAMGKAMRQQLSQSALAAK